MSDSDHTEPTKKSSLLQHKLGITANEIRHTYLGEEAEKASMEVVCNNPCQNNIMHLIFQNVKEGGMENLFK